MLICAIEILNIIIIVIIKSLAKQTKDEYAQDDMASPNLLWEMVKLKVREESLKYGTFKEKKLSKKRGGNRTNNCNS